MMALKTVGALALFLHVLATIDLSPEALENDDACSGESCSVELLQRSLLEKKMPMQSGLGSKQMNTTKCAAPAACTPSLEKMSVNNLNGADPNLPAVIRFSDVCAVNCQSVDFVISRSGPYQTPKPDKNGKHGKFARVNVAAGTKVNLTFSFVKAGEPAEVLLDSFYFSVFDLDSWIERGIAQQHERVTVSGFKEYALSSETSVKVEKTDSGLSFTSTVSGGLADNPTDPFILRKPQAAKAVTFLFKDTARFSAEFSIVGPNLYGARNFMFAGQSPLATVCPIPPPSGCSAKVSCDLKFNEVIDNKLGGVGSSIRYRHVCSDKCRKLDLLVSQATPYESKKAYKNGVSGSLGVLNVDAGKSLSLKFAFVEDGSVTPVKVESFYFSVFDLDGWISKKGKMLQQERVTVTNFDSYMVTKDTQLSVAPVDGGATFTSMASGGMTDNPTDPMALRGPQAAKTVSFLFINKDSFGVNFEVIGESSHGTRNFLFSGKSVLSECSEKVRVSD